LNKSNIGEQVIMQISDQEPVADFACSECHYVLAQVYLDPEGRTALMAWNGATGILTAYKAELACPKCAAKKTFHSTTASALRLGVVNYSK